MIFRFERIFFLSSSFFFLFHRNFCDQSCFSNDVTDRSGIRKISSHYRNAAESRMQSSRVKYSLFSRASASLSRQVDSAEHFYFHGGKWWYLQAVETAVSRRYPERCLSSPVFIKEPS